LESPRRPFRFFTAPWVLFRSEKSRIQLLNAWTPYVLYFIKTKGLYLGPRVAKFLSK
jgi:hypothetical protein